MIDARQIGDSIAALRRRGGMTQTELAVQLRVTHQAVSKWERGSCLPDLQNLVDLARLFRVAVDDLLGLNNGGEATPKARSNEWSASSERTALLPAGELGGVDPEGVWSETLALIRNDISKPSYDTWLKNTEAVIEDDRIVIVCNTPYQREWLYSRYSGRIVKALEQITGKTDVRIGFRTRKPGTPGASFHPFPKRRAEMLD